ncbi:MAG TPA: T9SS type A sorting domain-containing protein, partial [bacterium]|nr:T9SS type A sorting domain-containing protein [bacterium]
AASDSIYVQVDSASLPAGATYSVGALTVTPSTSYRTITFSWTPASADARSQPYVIHFAAQDNGCPVPQRACFVLPIHVPVLRPTGLPAVSAQPRATAYPNPFTTETRLTLPGGITRQPTEVLITDALGRLVDRLSVPAGEHTLIWRPRADVRPGLYYARVPGFRHTIALSRL